VVPEITVPKLVIPEITVPKLVAPKMEFPTESPRIAVPQYSGSMQTNNSNSSVSQDVNIDIRTDDPRAAGVAVKTELQRQLDTAQAQVRKGGR
jgi:hypothetical protein